MIDEKAKWEQEKKNLEEWVIKNRDIATDLQYQLDDAVKENEQLQKIIDSPIEDESWKADYDLLHQPDASGTVCVARKWHDAYRKAQNSNLLRKQDLEQSERVVEARLEVIDQQAAKIRELEDALVEERASRVYYEDSCPFRLWNDLKIKDKFLLGAYQQLQAEGKIGPDAKPHCWQITEERVEALQDAIDRYDIYDRCLVTLKRKMQNVAVLRAMLDEVK